MQLVKASLPPQPRLRSLLQLENQISAAAAARARRAVLVGSLETAGRDSAWARGMLGLAEERLMRLARSREVLIRGEDRDGDEPA